MLSPRPGAEAGSGTYTGALLIGAGAESIDDGAVCRLGILANGGVVRVERVIVDAGVEVRPDDVFASRVGFDGLFALVRPVFCPGVVGVVGAVGLFGG